MLHCKQLAVDLQGAFSPLHRHNFRSPDTSRKDGILMKKLLSMFLILLFLLCTAHAQESSLPPFDWHFHGTSHWQLDASGASVNLGNHTPDDSSTCTGCGCEILDWGDGAVDITDYDEYGNTLRYVTFSGEEMTYESIHTLTYNESGVVIRDLEYIGGVLYCETVYTVSEEGEQLPVSATAWNDDGTTSVSSYDEHGNRVRAVIYDTDGNIYHETISEYTAVEDEWFGLHYYESKSTSRFATGETFYSEVNEHGDTLRTRNTEADGTVWSDSAYEYEYKNGMKVWCKQYSFGVLTSEDFYNKDGDRVKEVEYREDGSTDVTLYDDRGDTISITTYDASGAVATITTYEWLYDDDDHQRETRRYIDGVLEEETIFHYDEEMNFTGYHEAVYHADGTRTVTTYDDAFDPILVTVYAQDGTILSEEIPDDPWGEEDADF